jgi:poly(A) polymerase
MEWDLSSSQSIYIKAQWLSSEEMQAIFQRLDSCGIQARFVGGCVRDALLQREKADGMDIDIAVRSTPDALLRCFENSDIKTIPIGIQFGSIRILKKNVSVDVTCLRKDIQSDGRHPVVIYTSDWHEDAIRRDFTMNALYADLSGRVFDPCGEGIADALARHVRFIGCADERIREDYLRILRFFRFSAWFGEGRIDEEGVKSCMALSSGIASLSAERVGSEVQRMLSAPNPVPAFKAMLSAGVLTFFFVKMLPWYWKNLWNLRRKPSRIPLG